MKYTNHHVSDMVVRINNAVSRIHSSVSFPNVKIIRSILELLVEEGYISSVKVEKNAVTASLKYDKRISVITDISVLSKPSNRVYSSANKIPTFYNGLGIVVVSTPKGILTDAQARNLGIGGELLCQVF